MYHQNITPQNPLTCFCHFPVLLLTWLVTMASWTTMHAQVMGKDTLIYHCPTHHCLNVVLLGDGYTAGEMEKFLEDAADVIDHLFDEVPYANYRQYFNVFAVRVVSQQSGIRHPGTASDCPQPGSHPVSAPNTYFGTTFDFAGIHRLVVPTFTNLVTAALLSTVPEYDIVIMLANSPFYGGSGGTFAATTMHTSAKLIAIHELGHSFAGLADEYWAGPQYAFERPNLTANPNPETIKWKNWLTPGTGIGIHPHSGDSSWYKPTHQACMMEQLHHPFCSVCSEATTMKILTMVNPVLNYFPTSEIVTVYGNREFGLELLLPEPNTLDVIWQLNEEWLSDTTAIIELDASLLMPGMNTLLATIKDNTELIRMNAPVHTREWSIFYDPASSSDTGPEVAILNVMVQPNPASGYVRLYTGNTQTVQVTVTDMTGRQVLKKTDYLPGNIIETGWWPSGIYLYRITGDRGSAVVRVVHE